MGFEAPRVLLGRLGAIASLSILAIAAACSALVDRADTQCGRDLDCAKFPGTVCENGGCVAGPTPPEGGVLDLDASLPVTCTSTQDCLAEHGGTSWVCRKTDGTCVSLLSPDCSQIAGAYTSDDVLLLGAVLPLAGPHATTGTALMNAISLGVGELDLDAVGGLPAPIDGGLPRPVAVVFCDESADPVRAATYLIEQLDVPVILGAGESASTVKIEQAFPHQELLISPRATVDLSAYSATRLVWRTCPANTVEADAIAALMNQTVEPALARGQPSLRVAIVAASDADSTQIVSRLEESLLVNDIGSSAALDAGALIAASYGDPDDVAGNPPDYSDAVTAVTEQLADAVIVVGSTQAVANIVGEIETSWPASATRRPTYVLSSGMQVPDLLTYVAAHTSWSLAPRVLGVAPGSNPASYTDLASFLVRYKAVYPAATIPEMFGVAQAYDAFYTVAYAAAFARNTDLIGLDLANALGVMLSGPKPTAIEFGPDGIVNALGALATGAPVRFNGASAPLPFETGTGDVTTDVQVWCVLPSATSSAFVFVDSNLFYRPAALLDAGSGADGGAGSLEGTLGAGCTL